jgi:hypothetical protein
VAVPAGGTGPPDVPKESDPFRRERNRGHRQRPGRRGTHCSSAGFRRGIGFSRSTVSAQHGRDRGVARGRRPPSQVRASRGLKIASLAPCPHGCRRHASAQVPISPTAARRSRSRSAAAPPRAQRQGPRSIRERLLARVG